MLNTNLLPMRPELIVCPFCECRNRIGVHSRRQRRYICHACDKTFAETVGTPLYGLKHPAWIVTLVLALLAAGCPPQAIVFAFGLDERTVTEWQIKAGQHAKQIQEQIVCQGQVDLGQVQADELYVSIEIVGMRHLQLECEKVSPLYDLGIKCQELFHIKRTGQRGRPRLVV